MSIIPSHMLHDDHCGGNIVRNLSDDFQERLMTASRSADHDQIRYRQFRRPAGAFRLLTGSPQTIMRVRIVFVRRRFAIPRMKSSEASLCHRPYGSMAHMWDKSEAGHRRQVRPKMRTHRIDAARNRVDDREPFIKALTRPTLACMLMVHLLSLPSYNHPEERNLLGYEPYSCQ